MRLCRYQGNDAVRAAFYEDSRIANLSNLADHVGLALPMSNDLLDYLPPNGRNAPAALTLFQRYNQLPTEDRESISRPLSSVKLLVPVAEPKKVLLLAGNYAEHIKEGGGIAAERQNTFPYFFWKPP